MAQVPALKALGDRIKAGETLSTPLIQPTTTTTTQPAQTQPQKYTPDPDSIMGKFKAVMDANGGQSPVVLIPAPNPAPEQPKVETGGQTMPHLQGAPASPMSTGYTPSYTGPDMAGMKEALESIFSNRQSSELAKLRESLATALQGYNAQETQAKQGAYQNRNAADAMNLQNQQAMKEVLANMGLQGDGQNLTIAAAQGASRLGAINDINLQESNVLQDITQKRSLLQNNAANQELALVQAIGADRAAALLDLLKYGDSRAFDMEKFNYGMYRDNVNDQFRADEFDWRKIMDEAGLTGNYSGQRTLAGQGLDLQNRNANLEAALRVGEATGRLVTPQTDWSGLFRQAASGNTPLNLTGQNQQLNQTQVMAGLTGMIPDGKGGMMQTTAEQQRQIGNLWNVASQTGVIPDALADMYGIPRGTKTQEAYQFAKNLSIDWYNAQTGRMNVNNNYELGLDRNNLDYIQAGLKGNEVETLSPTVAAQMLDQALTKQIGVDENGKAVYGKYTDPVTREKAFVKAWNESGVAPGNDTIEMLTKAGYTPDEIAALKKKYPEAFNSGAGDGGDSGPAKVDPAVFKGGVKGLSDTIDKYAQQYGVDPALVKAIIHHETGNLTSDAVKNKLNFGGIMGKNGLNTYQSVEAGIEAVAKLLGSDRYRGKSIAQIGSIYAPIGAGNDPNGINRYWVNNVTTYYQQYKR